MRSPLAAMASVLFFLTVSLFLKGILGEFVCEQLPVKVCAFAVSSSGKRCSMENYASTDGAIGFRCKTSDIMANVNLHEHIENDDCISSCGVERKTVGISTDNLLEPSFSKKLCSQDCQLNCHNIVDLYSNLALGEGVYLPAVCKALAADSSGKTTQILRSGEINLRRKTMEIRSSATASSPASIPEESAEPPIPSFQVST